MSSEVEFKSLRGRSKAEYLRYVGKLGEHYPKGSLRVLTERQVFDRRDPEKLRPSSLNQALVAVRMFYRDFLKLDWKRWNEFTIRRDQPLPVVLTRDETRRLFLVICSNRFKTVLALIYQCGLRIGEAVGLRTSTAGAA